MSRLEQIEEKINEEVKEIRTARERKDFSAVAAVQNRLEALFAEKKEAL